MSDRELPEALSLVDSLCALGGTRSSYMNRTGGRAARALSVAAVARLDADVLPQHACRSLPAQARLYAGGAGTRNAPAGYRSRRRSGVGNRVVRPRRALCLSGGGCLMSALIGGRSGNRGACAQPPAVCPAARQTHTRCHSSGLCLASHIPALLQSGVTSLKIEGRMKSPEYVYAVTKIYRRLLDERRAALPDEPERALSAVFSRSGFTDGYFTCRVGKSMFGVRPRPTRRAHAHFPSASRNAVYRCPLR